MAAAVAIGLDWRQAEQNRALIAAILDHRPADAIAALRAGASANTQDEGPAPTLPERLAGLWERVRGRPVARRAGGPSALFLAVGANETDVVEALFAHHAIPQRECAPDGETMIDLALSNNNGSLVRLLWRSRAYSEDDLYPLLTWAAGRGDYATVVDLIRHSAPTSSPGRTGGTPFFAAAQAGDWRIMRYLLAHGASVNDGGDGLDYAGALSVAAENNDFRLATILLARGADVNAEVRFGSALTKAAERDNTAMVRLLLAHGADPNVGNYHNTLPTIVAQQGCFAVLRLLLDAHADANCDAHGGRSLLGIVAASGDVDAVNTVLDAGAKINRRSNVPDTTALMDAAESGQLRTTRLLLTRGATVNLRLHVDDVYRSPGDTALDLSIRSQHPAVARLLRR
jgi:ankyrin repeat protein